MTFRGEGVRLIQLSKGQAPLVRLTQPDSKGWVFLLETES